MVFGLQMQLLQGKGTEQLLSDCNRILQIIASRTIVNENEELQLTTMATNIYSCTLKWKRQEGVFHKVKFDACADSDSVLDEWGQTDLSISMPPAAHENSYKNRDCSASLTMYKTLDRTMPTDTEVGQHFKAKKTYESDSLVVTLDVYPELRQRALWGHYIYVLLRRKGHEPICIPAYWKIAETEGGWAGWSTHGVSVVWCNETHAYFKVDHLTSFAILVQTTPTWVRM
ncbi:PREDICTED: cadherin EGF LAG seven-pass G-type receptor 2-like [Priapulus caudatus]|uniref:Cadherin EGF LAG seven-pass G-type receptor 2-like n=1 Tax=Priapulus caudatus TaxID=37621 RepID=A0ABM1F0U4_PRICU|nr:PREDICTED: cadherin EGF LAG seven-pass G-type receptor 2-like [Priapulus caudatus]